MKTLTLDIPDEVNETEVRMSVAAILFDKGTFSSGQAAEFVGISKKEFLVAVGKCGVSVFAETPEELRISLD